MSQEVQSLPPPIKSVVNNITIFKEEPTASWSDVKDAPVNFGKFKGTLFKDMIKDTKQLDYLRYLSEWSELEDPMKTHVKVALAYGLSHFKIPLEDALNYVVPFGRYKNKPLYKIITTSKGQSYTRWLSKRKNLTTAIPARRVVEFMSQKAKPIIKLNH